mmetsp:Transcript_25928/g.46796  ORF Transcript_25928/g.46796 Transcript_25928/m.46796 type:complete len:421 (-) Transcript_25928:25-1287(-)
MPSQLANAFIGLVGIATMLILMSQATLWGRVSSSKAGVIPHHHHTESKPQFGAQFKDPSPKGSLEPNKSGLGILPSLPSFCHENVALGRYVTDYLRKEKVGKLIWSCPPDKRCGGYGDRMKGIMSGFLIALLTNREFGIYHTDPMELKDVLQPTAHVKWDEYPENRSYAFRIKDKPPKSGKDLISKLSDVVWFETNQDLVEYLQSLSVFSPTLGRMGIGHRCIDLSCIYGCLFNTLFTVGEVLKSNMTQTSARHPRFVSVQIRTGGGEVSGWADPMRTSHYVCDKMWDVVDDFRKSKCPKCHIFLTTDSASQQRAAQKRYGSELFFVEGAITHSDRSSQAKAAKGFPKVVMDNLLIGQAEFGVISNSGFSYTAVWRTKLNTTVVRMNKQRTGYYIEPHLFDSPTSSWHVLEAPFIPLPER